MEPKLKKFVGGQKSILLTIFVVFSVALTALIMMFISPTVQAVDEKIVMDFRLTRIRWIQEAAVPLSGEANILLRDSKGRITGLKDGVFVEEIPHITLFIPENGALPNEEPARWQPPFYVSEDFYKYTDGHLTYIIEQIGDTAEEFSFTKFGGGFFVEYEAVTGKKDIEVYISSDGTEVSIANQENRYNLVLNRNINGESLIFYATDIPTTPEQIHQYTIVWDVPLGEETITLKIDINGDGIVDYTVVGEDRKIISDMIPARIESVVNEQVEPVADAPIPELGILKLVIVVIIATIVLGGILLVLIKRKNKKGRQEILK